MDGKLMNAFGGFFLELKTESQDWETFWFMNQPGEPTKPSGRRRFRSKGWSLQMSPQNTSWIPAKKVKKK